MTAPDAAHRLAKESQNLSLDLGLINGQPGLTGMAAAADAVKHLAWVTEQLGLQAQLLAEFVRAEHQAGHIEAHPGVTEEVDVDTSVGLITLGARSAAAAAEATTRALDAMHGVMGNLATRDNLPERIGVDPVMRSKGFTLNLLHAAVLGNDELLRELAGRASDDDAELLRAVVKSVSSAVGSAHGSNSVSGDTGPEAGSADG